MDSLHIDDHPEDRADIVGEESDEEIQVSSSTFIEPSEVRYEQSWKQNSTDR